MRPSRESPCKWRCDSARCVALLPLKVIIIIGGVCDCNGYDDDEVYEYTSLVRGQHIDMGETDYMVRLSWQRHTNEQPSPGARNGIIIIIIICWLNDVRGTGVISQISLSITVERIHRANRVARGKELRPTRASGTPVSLID